MRSFSERLGLNEYGRMDSESRSPLTHPHLLPVVADGAAAAAVRVPPLPLRLGSQTAAVRVPPLPLRLGSAFGLAPPRTCTCTLGKRLFGLPGRGTPCTRRSMLDTGPSSAIPQRLCSALLMVASDRIDPADYFATCQGNSLDGDRRESLADRRWGSCRGRPSREINLPTVETHRRSRWLQGTRNTTAGSPSQIGSP